MKGKFGVGDPHVHRAIFKTEMHCLLAANSDFSVIQIGFALDLN